jgi:predicted Zn-dependent peptidase
MKHTVTKVKLENGAEGLFIDVPGATVVDFEFNFRAGEYLVSRAKWEVPHLCEHVLLGANEKFPRARTFQAEFEKNGAYSNAHTSTYHITYESECADFEWERVLDLMLVAISKPLFLRDEFTAEFGNVNHFLHLHAVTREAYGLLAMTDRECLKQMKNVKLKDLVEHYKNTHTTSNMRFIVAGNLSRRREKIKSRIEKIDLPKGRQHIPLPSELPKPTEKPIFISKPSVKTLHFYLDAFALTRFDEKEWDALGLVNSMLTATLNSRILGEARERGLVYSMSSSLDTTHDSSVWWFGAQVIPKNALPLFEIIVRELKRVRSGDISEEDLEATKQYLLGRYQRSGQTVGGIMAGYSGRYYFDELIDDYEAIPARIRAITKKTIVEAAERMFTDNIGGIGILGDNKCRQLVEKLDETVRPLWSN